MFYTLGPLMVSFAIVVYYVFMRIKTRAATYETDEAKQKAEKLLIDSYNNCWTLFLFISYLVFPSSSLQILRGFACENSWFDNDEKYWDDGKCYDGFMGFSVAGCPKRSMLKYDYSIDCNATEYVEGWQLYCMLFVLIYPIGIPAMYFCLVYSARHVVNPDPVFVCADALLDDEKVSDVDAPFHVRNLALTLSTMYRDVATLREKAETLHEAAKAGVTERTEKRARESARRLREASASGKPGALSAKEKIQEKLFELKDKVQVPEAWEDFLPGYAAIVANYDSSIALMEQELVHMYRKDNKRAGMYKFLTDAYEPQYYYWEAIECVRRLALTGLLVFFGDGTKKQIVVACIISLGSLQLYVRCSPYMDDEVDTISTVAQLMTFTQLFGALLMRMDLLLGLSPTFASGVLIGSALTVPGFSFLGKLYESSDSILGTFVLLTAYLGAMRVKQMQDEKAAEKEAAEEEERERNRASSLVRQSKAGGGDLSLAAAAALAADPEAKEGESEELVEEMVRLSVEENLGETDLARLDALQVMHSSKEHCVIKEADERELVKKWLGMHVTELGEKSGEEVDNYIIPVHTSRSRGPGFKTSDQLRGEALLCLAPFDDADSIFQDETTKTAPLARAPKTKAGVEI